MYHLATDGYATRHEWARETLRLDQRAQEQAAKVILPVFTAEFPTMARRPLHSALDCTRFQAIFGWRLPLWYVALRLAMG